MKRYLVGFLLGIAAAVLGIAVANLVMAPGTGPQLLPERSQGSELPPPKTTRRSAYFPGTEELEPDEMRVVSCGSGMPSARPKQAAACWLVELGNGDKFLFDIGAGSHERIAAQRIPYDDLDKVFIGHLHVDHYGDLGAFWLGGTTMNRLTPLRVWGPSGQEEKYGTRYALERLKEAYVWDIATRSGVIDSRGMVLEINEFDYTKPGLIVYEENGVVIRSIPAIHGIDGAVSYILEWNGLKFAYSSDTFPNKWWIEYAQGADIAIHECLLTPILLVEKQGFTPYEALVVGTLGHTSPQQFGKVMSATQPRLAVAYHFYNDFDTAPTMLADIRKTYDGPVALALDYMVFNLTKDDLLVRMSVIDEEVWPSPPQREKERPQGRLTPMSDFVSSGREIYPMTLRRVWAEVNARYGTDLRPGKVAKELMGSAEDTEEAREAKREN